MAISAEKQQQITDARRTEIINAAMQLFDRHGYSETRVSDIAEQAGISKGLIYHYFHSKREILFAVLDQVEICINECNEIEDAVDSITLFVQRLLSYPYYEGYIPPIRIFFTALIQGEIQLDDSINPIRENFGSTYFGPIFQRGQEQGYFRDGDPELFGDSFWKYLIGCMTIMKVGKREEEYHPDMKLILELYRK